MRPDSSWMGTCTPHWRASAWCPELAHPGRSRLGPHLWEKDHVADRGRVGEEHDQPVDADAETGGRRHAVLERPDIVGVVEHRFLVAALLGGGLGAKPRRLLLRVVELREAVGDLAACDEELEAVSDEGVCIVGT